MKMKVGIFQALLSSVLAVLITGCGGSTGNSFSGGGGTTPAPTLTINGSTTPAGITVVLGQSVPFAVVSNASNCADSGSIPGLVAGSVLCNGSVSVTPTATGSFAITFSATNSTGSVSVGPITVTVIAPPPTITGVTTPACAPTSITTASGSTATCSAAATGTGSFNSAVTYSTSLGTISSAGVLSSSVAGTANVIATSVQDPTKSSAAFSVTVTVPPTPPTVTISANPTTVTSGNSTTLTIAATNATSCGIPGVSGVGTGTSIITVTPTTMPTTTYTVICTGVSGTTPASASVTVTVNPAVPSITVSCTPNAITTAQTAQCTATYQNLSSGVTWSGSGTASGGSVTTAGVFSSTAAGTFTITATSTQPGDGTISGSAMVSVTEAVPVVTGMDLPLWWYCDVKCGIAVFHIFGSGFAPGTTVTGSPNTGVSVVSVDNAGQLTVSTNIGNGYTLGKQTFTVSSPDGVYSSSISIALIGNQNTIAVGPDGEVYSYDQGHGTIWKYKSDGTPDGSIVLGVSDGIAIDDQTQDLLLAENSGNDGLYIITSTGGADAGNGSIGMGVSARNGIGCITQPVTVNLLSCVNLTQVNPFGFTEPTFNSIAVGSQPWSLWMGLFGTETDAYVYTRDGSPTLFKCNTFGGNANPSCASSVVLPGVTPVANLAALTGGWPVTGFDKGPASGTVAFLSTADHLLFRVNASTMQLIGSSINLPGVSTRAVADETNGNIIVAPVDTTRMVTTFTAVNATTGASTTLAAVANFVASGVGVSLDGTMLYAGQGNTFVFLPNK